MAIRSATTAILMIAAIIGTAIELVGSEPA
jgi:hypothetical protein